MKLVLATALVVAGIFQLAVIQEVSSGGGGRGFGGLRFGGSRFGGGGWGGRGISYRGSVGVGSIRSKGVWYLTQPKTIFASKSSKKFAKAATFGAGAYIGSKISSKVRFALFIILSMKKTLFLDYNTTLIKYMDGQNFSLKVPFDLEYSIMEAGNIRIMIGTRTPV